MASPSISAVRVPASRSPARLRLLGDERLAQLAGSGSERAFAAIYERYHQRLYRYSRSILHNDADAQDALQSTLAGAFAALQRGQRDAPLRPWLFRIAHNEAISLVRRRGDFRELTEAPECGVPSAENAAGGRARLALLVEDLRELPDRQRGALLMRELSGLSHEEIAIALGTSVGSAKQAIFEARRALAEFGEGRLMMCEDVRRTVSDGDGRALRGRRVRAHLRDCTTCAAFAAAIPARRADLHALALPLPPALAAGLLARLLGAGSGHGACGAGGVVAGVAGKTAGATLAAKVLVGVAVMATAAAGVTGALTLGKRDARRLPGAHTLPTTPADAAPRRVQRPIGAPASRGSRHDAHSGAHDRRPNSTISNAHGRSAGKARGIRGGSGAAHRGSEARGLRTVRHAGAPTRRRTGSKDARGGPGAGHRSGGPRVSAPTAGRPITAGGRSPTSSGNGQPSHAPTGVRGAASAFPSPRGPDAPIGASARARPPKIVPDSGRAGG